MSVRKRTHLVCALGQTASFRLSRIISLAIMLQTVTAPLLVGSLLLRGGPGKSADHFSYAFAGSYETDRGLTGLENLSQKRKVKTLFVTRSSLPLVNLWGGRLGLEGFTSTLNMQNV